MECQNRKNKVEKTVAKSLSTIFITLQPKNAKAENNQEIKSVQKIYFSAIDIEINRFSGFSVVNFIYYTTESVISKINRKERIVFADIPLATYKYVLRSGSKML